MCDCDFDGYPDVYETMTSKARKEHKCSSCGGKIVKGEHYNTTKMLYDGAWGTYKQHDVCTDISNKICCYEFQSCVFHGLSEEGKIWEPVKYSLKKKDREVRGLVAKLYWQLRKNDPERAKYFFKKGIERKAKKLTHYEINPWVQQQNRLQSINGTNLST